MAVVKFQVRSCRDTAQAENVCLSAGVCFHLLSLSLSLSLSRYLPSLPFLIPSFAVSDSLALSLSLSRSLALILFHAPPHSHAIRIHCAARYALYRPQCCTSAHANAHANANAYLERFSSPFTASCRTFWFT
jgi:hypothetical protein